LKKGRYAVLAAQIMGHDAMFTLFGVAYFFTVTIAFEGWGKRKGREGRLPIDQ
jgi:hypothetical protein